MPFRTNESSKQKQTKLLKARENAGDQVVIALSFASDWLREWYEFSEPITGRSKAKSMKSRMTFGA